MTRHVGVFTYENALLLMLGTTFGLVFMDRLAVNYLAPFIIHDLRLDATQVGLLSSALAITWAFSNIAAGRVSDLLGRRKPLLIATVVVFSLCSFVSGLAASFAVLIAARLFMGLAEGPVPPLVYALMAESSSRRRLGLNAGVITSGFLSFFAAVLGPVLLIGLAQAFNWRVAFWIAGVPGLIMALVIALFVRERPGAGPTVAMSPGLGEAWRGFVDAISRWNILLCTLIGCLTLAAIMIGNAFGALYLINARHIPPRQASLLLGVQGLANMAAFIVPALSDRIGRRTAVAFFSLLGVVTPLAVLYFHGPLWALAALLALGGLGQGVTAVLFVAIPAESVPARQLGTAVGFIPGVGELIGSVCGPAIAGWAADRTSLAAPFLIMGGCSLAAALLALALRETLGVIKPEDLSTMAGAVGDAPG